MALQLPREVAFPSMSRWAEIATPLADATEASGQLLASEHCPELDFSLHIPSDFVRVSIRIKDSGKAHWSNIIILILIIDNSPSTSITTINTTTNNNINILDSRCHPMNYEILFARTRTFSV